LFTLFDEKRQEWHHGRDIQNNKNNKEQRENNVYQNADA